MEIIKYRTSAGAPWQELVALKGEPGAPGYTPVKGIDYWTAEERNGMIEEIAGQYASQDYVNDRFFGYDLLLRDDIEAARREDLGRYHLHVPQITSDPIPEDSELTLGDIIKNGCVKTDDEDVFLKAMNAGLPVYFTWDGDYQDQYNISNMARSFTISSDTMRRMGFTPMTRDGSELNETNGVWRVIEISAHITDNGAVLSNQLTESLAFYPDRDIAIHSTRGQTIYFKHNNTLGILYLHNYYIVNPATGYAELIYATGKPEFILDYFNKQAIYDNRKSGLTAMTVGQAIDELAEAIDNGGGGGGGNLTNYYTKSETEALIETNSANYYTTSEVYTKSEVDKEITDAMKNVAVPDMSGYVLRSEIAGFASTSYVDQAIAAITNGDEVSY